MTQHKDFLTRLLRQMLLIRRFEEKSGELYGIRKIGGFCHLYSGQEAVAVGSIATLDLSRDHVLTAYRDHGHALAIGMDPKVVMAELFGKSTGSSKGKGGSMHLFDPNRHFWGGNGIVGAHIPVATGVAFKIHYNEEAGVVLCFFGDGAIHQGVFHESLNMARIWNLPIVYICENNQYGMGTDYKRVSAEPDFYKLAQSYRMHGEQIDGMDVEHVYDQVMAATAMARKGNPVLLEAKTYRYRGHSMSDPAKYRTKEEVDQFKTQDPILHLKSKLMNNHDLTAEDFDLLDQEAMTQVENAVKFADESAAPAVESIFEDVYTNNSSPPPGES